MASIASGRTRLGLVPALSTSKRSPASCLRRPSAIWLRAELPVHRIRTRFLALIVHPVKQGSCRNSSYELGGDKAGNIRRANTGERVGGGPGECDSRIGERSRRRKPVRPGDVGANC